ncbi:heparan-alpha-glucosaminide N-acetyltransferase [Thalictrum thalictroides]|uniref:Heparan-alpha-glucosaminide N-acetyltransferase n=1 Tax=Thalictrum thalictroides TaxID=46969 RepID=A0A7J6WTR3_THATH|nr:heparan-alpha-glucosaminide N-acetyltransferase [Thalictrum thalictroides]
MRLMGTLQRIAIAYLVSALCEIWIKGKDDVVKSEFSLFKRYRVQLGIAVLLTVAHTALLYGLRVPDWEYQIQTGSTSSAVTGKTFLSVNCGVRGNTGPACNAVGMIDRMILGTQHMYARPIYSRTKQCSIKSPNYGPLPIDAPSWCQAPFEPEGLLSSIMAIVSCILGLHYGHVIVHIKDHKKRIMQWTIPALVLLVLGFIMHFSGMHFNKVLYSSSYTCLTAGTAGILFAGIYVLVDVYGYRRLTFVLEWMGKHSLMIYILAACNLLPIFLQGFYWKNPENNIFRLIGIKSEPPTEFCNKKAEAAQKEDWLTVISFVIAVLAMVIATFSTGTDSKSFQFRKNDAQSEDDVPYGYGFFHFVLPPELCTLPCCSLVGILTRP